MSKIKVLIVDDHKLFRHGLRVICEAKGKFAVVGEAENGQQAVEMAARLSPDVVLMDIQMPVLDGVEATRLILENDPSIRIIMLSMHKQDQYVFDAIRAGARAYLLKDVGWNELAEAIEAVCRGEALINPELTARVLDEFRQLSQSGGVPSAPPATESNELTAGEMAVLRLVAQGEDNAAIAEQLVLSEKTITNRLSNIYRKLQVNNRTQAALHALRQGWAELENER